MLKSRWANILLGARPEGGRWDGEQFFGNQGQERRRLREPQLMDRRAGEGGSPTGRGTVVTGRAVSSFQSRGRGRRSGSNGLIKVRRVPAGEDIKESEVGLQYPGRMLVLAKLTNAASQAKQRPRPLGG